MIDTDAQPIVEAYARSFPGDKELGASGMGQMMTLSTLVVGEADGLTRLSFDEVLETMESFQVNGSRDHAWPTNEQDLAEYITMFRAQLEVKKTELRRKL